MILDLTYEFDKACLSLLKDQPQLLRFVRQHERRPLVLKNLCREIQGYERSFKSRVTMETREKLIRSVAEMFIGAVKLQRDQALWSEAQKKAVASQNSLKNDVAQLIKEVPNGKTENTKP